MKALSLTQPYATLIALGEKKIETRGWSTSYRGPVAIHAAKGWPKWAKDTCLEEPFRSVLGRSGHVVVDGSRLTLSIEIGSIVAVGELVHVFMTGDILNYRHRTPTVRGPRGLTYEMTANEFEFGDFAPGRHGWLFQNVRRIDPIECKGALGLWTVPPEIAAQVDEQLRRSA